MALGQDQRGAVGQRGPLQVGELQLGELGGLRHAEAAVHLAWRGGVTRVRIRQHERIRGDRRVLRHDAALTRHHHQHVVPGRQPLAARSLHIGGGGRGDALLRRAEAAGIALQHRAAREYVGLATEAANPLHAAYEARTQHGARLLQLLVAGAFGDEPRQLLINRRFHLPGLHAVTHAGDDHELAAQLRAAGKHLHVVHQTILVQQAAVQARGAAAAQHLAQHPQVLDIGRAALGHIPHPVHAGLRHVVLEGGAGALSALGRVHFRLGHGRSGGNMAEVAGHLLPGGLHVDVTGQHQHRVVGAVPGVEPLVHVFQRGRVQIVHRADHAVLVGMAVGVHHPVDHLPGLAVGLVLALALLVLHHPALLIQRSLVHRAQQVAHAVRFHPQRHVQRGGGHVLEVIGAVGVGGAVHVGGTDLLERGEVFTGIVFRALEHQVLEQMGKAGTALRLVLAAHVVPDVDRHDRRLAVGVHDHPQPVGQGEAVMGNIHRRRRRRVLCSGRLGRQHGQGKGHRQRQQRNAATAQGGEAGKCHRRSFALHGCGSALS